MSVPKIVDVGHAHDRFYGSGVRSYHLQAGFAGAGTAGGESMKLMIGTQVSIRLLMLTESAEGFSAVIMT